MHRENIGGAKKDMRAFGWLSCAGLPGVSPPASGSVTNRPS